MRTIASINQSITCARVVIVCACRLQAITSALAGASDRRKDVEVLQAKLVDIEKSTLGRKAEVEEEVRTALEHWVVGNSSVLLLLPCSLDPWLVVYFFATEHSMCLASLVQLSSIVPLLEQAKQAVGSIDNAALAEVRAMQSPPEAVHDVLSAVLQVSALFPESHFARVGRPWECPYPPP